MEHTTTIRLSRGRALPGPRAAVHDAAYLLAGLPLGILSFTVAVTGLALAAGLAVTLVGIPVLLATLLLVRGLADLERVRAAPLLGQAIPRGGRSWSGGLWSRTRSAATDPEAWRGVLWALLLLPVGIVGFTAALSLWSVALAFATSPLWTWALPAPDGETIALLDERTAGYEALRVLIGLALIGLAALACRALAQASAALARATLRPRAPSSTAVDDLTAPRPGS